MSAVGENPWNNIEFEMEPGKPWVTYTFNDKADSHRIISILSNLTNLNQLNLKHSAALFRGVSSTKFSLKPRLCRIATQMPLEKKLGYEFDSINYFRQRAPHYLPERVFPSKPWDIEEWLALMQHYGAATRLLDWTASVNVAFYFAVHERPDEDGCVWVIWKGDFQSSMPAYDYKMDEKSERKIYTNREPFVEFGQNTALPIVNVFDSTIKTERMVAQHSLYTYCHQQEADHGEIVGKQLASAYPIDSDAENITKQLCRFIISPSIKNYLRQHLSKLGISAATLFPGLDGLGRTINEMFVTHSEVYAPIWQSSGQ